MSELLPLVGAALRRPADELIELDRRALELAFIPGEYVTVTVRDRRTRQVSDVTLSLATGERHASEDLRAQDRAAGAALTALAPGLRALMLRHPGLPELRVRVVSATGAREVWASVREVAALAGNGDVIRVDLLGEPEVPDARDAR